jgi:hypothetical protein
MLTLSMFIISSQHNIYSQLSYKYSHKSFLDSLIIEKPKFSKLKLQIRVWTSEWELGNQKLLLLNLDKNSKWSGLGYSFYCYNDMNCNISDTKERYDLDLKDWSLIWPDIVLDSILNIPTQEEIVKEFQLIYEANLGDSISIDEFGRKQYPLLIYTGGKDFTIEVLRRFKKEKLIFRSPKYEYDFYKKHGVDIRHYLKLIELRKTIESL